MKKFIAEIVKNEVLASNNSQDAPIFDLSELNLLQLTQSLRDSLNKKSSTFIFLRRRENEKLELQRSKVDHLIALITSLTAANRTIATYQADLILSKAILQNTIDGYHAKARREAELLVKQHQNELRKIDDEARERNLKLQTMEIANLKAKAEVNQMEARTEQDKIKADLMREAVNNISKLPPSLQTYIYRAVFNPQDKQEDDILLQDEIRAYVKTEREAQAEQKKHEARQQATKADLDELKLKREREKPRGV